MRLLALAPLALVVLPLVGVDARPPAIGEADHRIAARRPVAVMVAPDRIAPSVDIGRVAADSGGGLLGYLLDNKKSILAANASDRADATLRPLAQALDHFDARPLALAATTKAMPQVGWLEPGAISVVDWHAPDGLRAFSAAYPSPQIALVRYGLQTSPDFTQIQVIADVALADAKSLKTLAEQRVISVVQLNQRSYAGAANVARWSANDGKLARAAITAAFDRLATVLPEVLSLTPVAYDRATDRKTTAAAFAAGYRGPLLSQDALGPVLWSKGDGFIAVQQAED